MTLIHNHGNHSSSDALGSISFEKLVLPQEYLIYLKDKLTLRTLWACISFKAWTTIDLLQVLKPLDNWHLSLMNSYGIDFHNLSISIHVDQTFGHRPLAHYYENLNLQNLYIFTSALYQTVGMQLSICSNRL